MYHTTTSFRDDASAQYHLDPFCTQGLLEALTSSNPETVPGQNAAAGSAATRNSLLDHAPVDDLNGFINTESFEVLKLGLSFPNTYENRKLAAAIAELCEDLPLLIHQVIAVIRDKNENLMRFSTGQYGMKEFLVEVRKQLTVAESRPSVSSVGLSVFRIFEITFEQLTKTPKGALALECLDVMAILNPDNIPMRLLYALLDESKEESWPEVLKLLHKFNLITTGDGCYKVHSLVQAVKLDYNAYKGNGINVDKSVSTPVLTKFVLLVEKTPVSEESAILGILNNALRIINLKPAWFEAKPYIQFVEVVARKRNNLLFMDYNWKEKIDSAFSARINDC